MHSTAASVAEAFLDLCDRERLTPDPRLRILGATFVGPPHAQLHTTRTVERVGDLGRLHEGLATSEERRGRGAWYTPRALADDLVARVVQQPMTLGDPTCGGGVFLLAAADRMRHLGADPGTVVGSMLWGADVDPVAVAVAEAELWLWSAIAGRPVVAGERLVVGDVLVDVEMPPLDAIVGNPPFLGQLKSATTVAPARRRSLVERWGRAVQPYTDASWLFLLAAVEAVEPGGMVALIQPQSLLAARDASAIRAAIDVRAELVDCWIGEPGAFEAAVDVCAPILRVADGAPGGSNDWRCALREVLGVPPVMFPERGVCLATDASVIAGFRDEYYGLVDAVGEGGPGPRLVTSGSIDPLLLRDAPTRFAKKTWTDPRIEPARAIGRAGRWVADQMRPKLVVASQTKVIEAVADLDGSVVAGVPAIAVVPDDPARLWHLAAALHTPSVSAWVLGRSAGTGMSRDNIRPTAELLGSIPLPVDAELWGVAAGLAERLADGENLWDEFAHAADASYGIDDPAVRSWWLERLPVR